MISISNILLTELFSDEQYNKNLLKTTRNKPIVDAILNRKKITFYYTGPRRPKKDNVKSGYRVKVEPVAMGLSKKGNLVLRAWVEPPSASKKGFSKTHWRTFILARTKNVEVTDETFHVKRPGYNEDGDKSMSVVYVKTRWDETPEPNVEPKPEPVEPTEPQVKPSVEPSEPQQEPAAEPQPEPSVEPEPSEPSPQPQASEPSVEPSVEPTIQKQEPKPEVKPTELPQPKPRTKPSREPQTKLEPTEPQPEKSPEEKPDEEEDTNLMESLKRIKRLMYS
jgi:hypothetical protein